MENHKRKREISEKTKFLRLVFFMDNVIEMMFHIKIVVRIFANNKYLMMNKRTEETEMQVLLARYAKALGHPTRIAILYFLLKQKNCYFGDIHEELPIAKATVSQHLKELKEAGLIQGEVEAPKVKYCINKENWERASKLFGELFQSKCFENTDCCK